MKFRSLRWVSLIVCICTLFCLMPEVQAQVRKPGPTAESEIRQWLDHWAKAFAARDVDAIMSMYAPDVVAYDVVPPLQYVGKDAYRKDYQEFMVQYKGNLQVEYRDMRILTSGDLAVASGLERLSGMLTTGENSTVWVRFTTVFRKVNGKWLDVQDHVSVPVDFATGKAKLDLVP